MEKFHVKLLSLIYNSPSPKNNGLARALRLSVFEVGGRWLRDTGSALLKNVECAG